MDGQRFDDLSRAVARGTTRRQALRLLGGGLAAALLAAAGRGQRAAAAPPPPTASCGTLRDLCVASVPECGEFTTIANLLHCLAGMASWTPQCSAYLTVCHTLCGNAVCGTCGDNETCAASGNPGGQLLCRCLAL